MNKASQHAILIVLTFVVSYYGRGWYGEFFDVSISSFIGRILYVYAWWVILPLLMTGTLYGFSQIPKRLGLSQGFFFGLGLAVVTVLPMFLGSAFLGEYNSDITILAIAQRTLFAGFMEELLFRGFLFGLLFKYCRWGFIPSAGLGAIIFGMAHLYQGTGLGQSLGVFAVTFMGALWFAWLYIEWKENLWIPIFLHVFMNLSWVLFQVSDNALGGYASNVFRIITIALTILLTIRFNKTKDRFRIHKANLLINNNYHNIT